MLKMQIHFIAIGGSIMHSLAIELRSQGHVVTGSDDEIHEPSRSNLIDHNLLPKKIGWDSKMIHSSLDMVILGMHAKQDNPELLEAIKNNIPTISFPEFILKYAKDKKRIVVAGSHGKTTITSMIIHTLHKNNIPVDYVVGAKNQLITKQVHLNNNDTIIIEGDEYFSSAIDSTPKFMYYNPHILIVSGLAWDHVNVFPTLHSYHNAFHNLFIKVLRQKGLIFYCGDDKYLAKYFNKKDGSRPYYLPEYIVENRRFKVIYDSAIFPLRIFGKHNLYNLRAAQYVCQELGVDQHSFLKAIKYFQGAERRLSLLKNIEGHSAIYYDFAHSPSKVHATLDAVKELYQHRQLIACLELHTYSSLNIKFLPEYAEVFHACDHVIIYFSELEVLRKGLSDLNDSDVNSIINHPNVSIIKEKSVLKDTLLSFKLYNMNLVLMSSGNFNGLRIDSLF